MERLNGRPHDSGENALSQQVSYMPEIESTVNNIIVGGVTAYNYSDNKEKPAKVTHFDAKLNFSNVDKYYYLGGITGNNDAKALLNSAHMPERYMKIMVRQARVTEESQVITAAH